MEEEEEELTCAAAYAQLKQAWVNERCSPDILPFEVECVRTLKDSIDQREEELAALDTKTVNEDQATIVEAVRLELQRVRFLLKSYLRERVRKLLRHPRHYLDETGEWYSYLCDAELDLLADYARLTELTMDHSVLGRLPQRYRKLPKKAHTEPDITEHVFIRMLRDVREHRFSNESTATLDAGDVWIARYDQVHSLIKAGDAHFA
ncbi:MAG: hypothetical protein MHM6MM_005603 [Cercozoa sp. M6MM]